MTDSESNINVMTLSIQFHYAESSILYFYCNAECYYAECRYAECYYAECRYAECYYAKTIGLYNKHITIVNNDHK